MQTLHQELIYLLDSAFGTVEGGGKLFAKFLHSHQDSADKPSEYLQKLQTLLNAVVKQGGMASDESHFSFDAYHCLLREKINMRYGKISDVRLLGKKLQIIPAGQKLIVEGISHLSHFV